MLDCTIPWIPKSGGPRADAKIITISADPLTIRYPFKEIEADLLVQGDPCAALRLLRECLAGLPKSGNGAADDRRKTVATAREDNLARRRKLIDQVKDQSPVHLAWLAHCLNEVKTKDAIVISELGVPLAQLNLTAPRSYMGNLLSGGLGFGLGAALAITPHNAGDTPAADDRAVRFAAEQLIRFTRGEPLQNVVRAAGGA